MKSWLVWEKKVTERKRVVATAGEMAWYVGGWGVGGGGLRHRLVVQLTSPCQTVTGPYATPPPNHPPAPALPPSTLDRMINGVSGHASTTVPDYTKYYHNFFFLSFYFFAIITETSVLHETQKTNVPTRSIVFCLFVCHFVNNRREKKNVHAVLVIKSASHPISSTLE